MKPWEITWQHLPAIQWKLSGPETHYSGSYTYPEILKYSWVLEAVCCCCCCCRCCCCCCCFCCCCCCCCCFGVALIATETKHMMYCASRNVAIPCIMLLVSANFKEYSYNMYTYTSASNLLGPLHIQRLINLLACGTIKCHFGRHLIGNYTEPLHFRL